MREEMTLHVNSRSLVRSAIFHLKADTPSVTISSPKMLRKPSVGMLHASEVTTLSLSLPKLDDQAKRTVSLEKENEGVETANLEKVEARVPLRTTNAGGAATTVTGLTHVPNEETEAGAVKETAIARRAAASSVEEEATNNVIVEAAPSAVGVLTRGLDAVAEGMNEEVDGDLTATAVVGAQKTDTAADTAETGEGLTHPTTATEPEDTIEEAEPLREGAVGTDAMTEGTTTESVELVGLHTSQTLDLILTLVRLANDHPPGQTSKKKADAKPATVTMTCILETVVSTESEDTAALRNLATKGRTQRTTRWSRSRLAKTNPLNLNLRTTKIAPTIEQVPNYLPRTWSSSDGFCSDSLRLANIPSGCTNTTRPYLVLRQSD